MEVTEHIGCESANTQVLQVSGMWGLCLLDAHAAFLLPQSGPQETSFFFLYFNLLATLHSMLDLSSLTRNWNLWPLIGSMES